MLDHVGRGRSEGDHPRASQGIGAVRRGDQRTGTALLSLRRRQDREVPRRQAAPGVPRTRRARHPGAVRERAVHFPARPGPARVPTRRAGSRAGEDDPARLCHRVRLLSPHPAHAVARDEGGRAPVLCWANQRNDGIRGSGRPGCRGRDQRGAPDPRRGAGDPGPRRCVHWRPRGRPRDPWRGRAVPAVHIALRVPAAAPAGQRAAAAGAARRAPGAAQYGGAAGGGGGGRGSRGRRCRGAAAAALADTGTSLGEPERVASVARRPGVSLRALLEAAGVPVTADEAAVVSAGIELKYDGYLAREREAAARLAELASFALPADLPYVEFKSLATEARQKLDRIRPTSLAQAARIPGVSPSDLHNLVVETARWRRRVA